MNSEFILRINTSKENYKIINSLLNVAPSSSKHYWELSIREDSNFYNRSIIYFLDLLEPNLGKLREIGLSDDDISIWYLYEYVEQCNIEFQPNDLKRIGDAGITLCISCWPG